MPYCPNGHGPKEGRYCPECGSELLTALPSGDSLRIRSPEAHANVQVVMPGGGGPAAAAPTLVMCPKCGRRSPETDTFDCQGPCGRTNLCLRHFDEEYDLCRDCAAEKRGVAQQEAARQAKLHSDLEGLAAQVQRLTAELAQVTAARDAAHRELAEARANLRRAEQHAQAAAAAAQAKLADVQKTLSEWRARGEKAEAQLAEIAAKAKAEAEARRQAELKRQQEEAEAARRQAEEATKRRGSASVPAPWQRIGIELITIPAGEFLYGENKQKFSLPAYRIAKTPVTNAQYKAFVDATGHQPPSHWSGGQMPQGQEQHPVVNVSWDDAQAFCAWAGLRLPAEQEWEKAARGTDGREYPWGAWDLGRCNSSEAKIGATTPVDRFPSGASPYGVLDAAGNVWEWCADYYDNNQRPRVLRGGSFNNEARTVRCAVRYRYNPENRFDNFGFRVVSPGL